MCGIFAYIGDKQAAALLVAALKRLEYRGYDSAGVCIQGSPLKIRKKVGKVLNLESECANACEDGKLEGTSGIAHTRWATHGKPSDRNAHPHTDTVRSIAVVHNGVVENYSALKQQLAGKGYTFTSETDTELLAHLVHDLHKQMPEATWTQVVAMTLQLVEGAYGVVFLFQEDPDLIVGARKGSPLILGVGTGENMLASDASAIIEHTKDVIYIRDGELVELRRRSYKVLNSEETARCVTAASPRSLDIAQSPIVRLEMSLEEIEKAGYAHFMLKEIMDQPNALRNALRGRLYLSSASGDGNSEAWKLKLGGLEKVLEEEGQSGRSPLQRMATANRMIICACGTSFHSGMIAKYAMEHLARLPVEVEYASEFRYRRPLISPEDVVVAVSQSGETADTLEAINIAKASKALTLGVVNVVGSSIARATDAGVYLHAGPEIGVASTKAFTCQVLALLMIALQLALQRGFLSDEEFNSYCGALNGVPTLIEDWLEPLSKQIRVIAKHFRLATNALFCGTGIHFPVALEGALKLKEISYIHAEGFTASEMRHGPLTLVRSFIPVVCIAMRSDPAYRQIKANIQEFRAKNAALLVVTDEGNSDFDRIASFVVHCPSTKLEFEPVTAVVPLQLLSYYIADMRGCSIDQPRNLAKSVTVE